MSVAIDCAHCGKCHEVRGCDYDRAQKAGNKLYCGRKCAGLGRRKHKSKAQRVAEKAEYDRIYRERNHNNLKARRAAYFKRTYDPVKAAVERKKRMPKHVEYCRRPEYKRWKSQYDKQYLAKKTYGPLADVAILAAELNREIKQRMTNHEIKWENGTTNKAQFRDRDGTEKRRKGRPRHRYGRRNNSAAHG